ncbi:MAG TPA: flagellin [Bryobacteraceae bacterium]|nr:flagellin [Bryobacteraceae bacterium]
MYTISSSADVFLSSLNTLEQRMLNDNRQVSSGLRVQTVADDPTAVNDILELNSQIGSNTQIGQNLNIVQTEVNTAESAINSATQLMDMASQLAAQGATGTSGTATRQQLATQVSGLLQQMQGLANTQVEGRYVFSGSSDQTAPYGALDLATNTTNGVGAYLGTASTRAVQGPEGSSISIGLTAQQIFDGGTAGTPATSVFQSLTELYNGLTADNQSSIEQAASDITSSVTYLNTQQASYGAIQQTVAAAMDQQSSLNTNFQSELSAIQDVDSATAITNLQQDTTTEQAAMAAYSSLPKKSLFDYLG